MFVCMCLTVCLYVCDGMFVCMSDGMCVCMSGDGGVCQRVEADGYGHLLVHPKLHVSALHYTTLQYNEIIHYSTVASYLAIYIAI